MGLGGVTDVKQSVGTGGYELSQNEPNPFFESTKISFSIPEDARCKISFYSTTGELLKVTEGDYLAGEHEIKINRADFEVQTNVLYYRLSTEKYTSESKKMISIDK